MSVNSVNSNSGNTGYAAAAGAAAGAGAGAYAASKASPAIIQFAQNTASADTFVTSSAKKAVDLAKKNPDVTQEQIGKAFAGASEKAQDVYKNLEKFKITDIAKKAADFATKHKTGAIAIGAAIVAGVGALIGTTAANKSNESVSSFNG